MNIDDKDMCDVINAYRAYGLPGIVIIWNGVEVDRFTGDTRCTREEKDKRFEQAVRRCGLS
jgi:hypothetical protein